MSTNDRRERPSAAALTTAAADLWFLPERWRRRSGAWFRLALIATVLVGALAYVSWRGIWSHPSQVELRAEELLAPLFVPEVEIEAIAESDARTSSATGRDERDGALRIVTVAMPRERRSVRSAEAASARDSTAGSDASGHARAGAEIDGSADTDLILAAERIVPLSGVDRSSVPPGRRFRGRIEGRPTEAYRIDRVTVDLGRLGFDRFLRRDDRADSPSTTAPASTVPPALRHDELSKLLERLEAEVEVGTLAIQGLEAIGIETRSPLILRHVRSVSTGKGWIFQGTIAEGPFGRSGEVEIWIEQRPLRVRDVSVALRDTESKIGLDRFLPISARELWRRLDPRGRFDIALDVHVDERGGTTGGTPTERSERGDASDESGLVGGGARTDSASVTNAAAREDDARRAAGGGTTTSPAHGIDGVERGESTEVILESTHFDSVIRAPAKGEIDLEGFDGRIRIETGRTFARLSIAKREEPAQAREAQPEERTTSGASCRLFGMEGILRGALDREGRGGLELELRARTVGELPRGRLPPAMREVLDALRPKGVIGAARVRLEASGASAELRIADVEIAGELGFLVPTAEVRLEETGVQTGRGSISVAGLSWARWAGKVTGPDPAVRIEWKPGELVIEGSEIVVDNTSLAGPPATDAPTGKLDFRFVGDLEGKTFRGEGGWTQLLLDAPPLTASSVDGEFRASSSAAAMSEGEDPTTPEAKARGVVRAVGLTLPQAGPEGESLSFRTSDASWWLEPEGDVRLRARFAADGRVLRAHGRIAPNGGLDVRCLLETGGKVEESAPRPLDSFETWNAVDPASEEARGTAEAETDVEPGAENAQAGTAVDAQTQPEIRAWRLTGTLLAPVAEPITPAEWPESESAPAR